LLDYDATCNHNVQHVPESIARTPLDRDDYATLQINPIHNLQNLDPATLKALQSLLEKDRKRFLGIPEERIATNFKRVRRGTGLAERSRSAPAQRALTARLANPK
jgi:hypothetical protein